jgi:hypothetical protein
MELVSGIYCNWISKIMLDINFNLLKFFSEIFSENVYVIFMLQILYITNIKYVDDTYVDKSFILPFLKIIFKLLNYCLRTHVNIVKSHSAYNMGVTVATFHAKHLVLFYSFKCPAKFEDNNMEKINNHINITE